jgi:hypothetical protein
MNFLTTIRFRFVPLLLLSGILSAPATALSAERDPFIYVLEAELLGGYSEVAGRDGEFSSIDSWLFSPTVRLNDDLYWINLYNGDYNRSAQVVAQDEGGRQTETTQSHHIATSLKYEVSESWSLRPMFFADWNFVNETEDEDFGEGLYDYDDIGGGIESVWNWAPAQGRENETRLGFRYLSREYPNYQSLLSLFDPNGAVETDEKDLDGYKTNLGFNSRSKDSWSWGLEGIFFYKDYTDKKTINLNGIRNPGETREDFVEYVNASASHPVGPDWTFGLEGQFVYSDSNLDFYDTHNTLGLADDDFIEDHFDYYSFLVRPSFTYSRQWDKDRRFIFRVDYAFYALQYPDRLAQNATGVYLDEEQHDTTHTVSAKVSVPLTGNISWVTYGSYLTADSNQKFEAFYLYDYDLWTTVTGFSFKY